MRIAIGLVALIYARAAGAETSGHGGLNLRADSGAHPVRATAGIDVGGLDVSLTLDPMVLTDGQFDADLLSTTKLSDGGFGFVLGWRTTSIGILGGTQSQEKLVLGIGAPLPVSPPLRIHWTFEATAMVVKHGGGLPTDWISFEQGRDFVDLINFGMFVTFEYTSAAR
jgi:hypothetical protein